MARKSVPFDIVVHIPANTDSVEVQKIYESFYSEQIVKRLDESNVSPDMKLELLNILQDRII